MASMTTYKLGGPAAWFVDVEDVDHLSRVLASLTTDTDVLLLGRGSNLLVSDSGFPGVVIRLSGRFLDVDVDDDGVVHAGGAAPMPRIARAAADRGRCGLEFLSGIPGTVGGGIVMNAGGHGADIGQRLVGAVIVDRLTGVRSKRSPEELELAYRHSNLGPGDIVVSASFRTDPCDRGEADARIREIIRWRREHQPGGTFNAGSVFKNPPGDAAGRLIDAAGLKGLRRGGVAVSEIHANFLTADEDATAQDVWDLIWAVRRRVGEATGVWLDPEIRFAGSFTRSGDEEQGPGITP
jgi:UDP-N-acetylmuramate dehydrogenase